LWVGKEKRGEESLVKRRVVRSGYTLKSGVKAPASEGGRYKGRRTARVRRI
jgi:hypothetical protein